MSQCPKCAANGQDRSRDNLAIYSDGHHYCFKCGYLHLPNDLIWRLSPREDPQPYKGVTLPQDVTPSLPYEAWEWLNQYNFTQLDARKNNVFWSDSNSRIIFPYFLSDGTLHAWQGRHIPTEKKPEGKKWFSQGQLHDFIHEVGPTGRHAILVEDIVSAIKVGHHIKSIPLFGSKLSKECVLRLKYIVDSISLWLDPDMRSKSVKMASMSTSLGLPCSVILSDKDPKEHTHEEIKNLTKQ